MTLQDCVKFLLDNGYMSIVRKKYCVTAKFNKEIAKVDQGIVHVSGIPLVRDIVHSAKDLSKIEWRNQYIAFIKEAQVPAKCEGSNGEMYDCNKFSESAMKSFKEIILKEQIDLRVLTAVTKLYYAKPGKYKLKIGSYIETGAWRSDYAAMIDVAAENGIEGIQNHIKTQLNDGKPFHNVEFG
jgi:hypothetical protein